MKLKTKLKGIKTYLELQNTQLTIYTTDLNRNCRNSDAEVQALREELNPFKNTEKKQGVQCEPAGEEGGLEEDGKMEVDEKVDSKKKWDRKKDLKKTAAVWRSSRICRSTFRAGSKKSDSSIFNILNNSGMIFCLSTKECRRGLQSCRVCRTKRGDVRTMCTVT